MKPRDGHIRVLPIHVANKIAAGEVVERPASVVKELVENSIDAGAKNIRISIAQGGRKLVSVADDGCGMTRDDAVLSLERQATSKILDVSDIEEIDTLGFRGEAIPSIASVSRFSITTRRHDSEEGTRVDVNAGTLAGVTSAGCPPGTIVEARDLFCNVPARKKFLRAYATEEGHVKNIFTIHALAHPGIAWSLTVDGREVYRLAPAKSPLERIRELFGREFVESLLEIDHPGDKVSVTGYIERPNRSFPTRRDQFVFINGRPATAPAVAYALREAYPRRQGDARPAAIIFISLPPNQIDVNVHPTKREIRFRDNTTVRTALMEAIENALKEAGGKSNEEFKTRNEAPASGGQERPAAFCAAPTAAPTNPEPRKLSPASSLGTKDGIKPSPTLKEPSATTPVPAPLPLAAPAGTKAKPWRWFKYLATTEVGYILLETDSGIVTLNPRAARERIAFEQLTARASAPVPSQTLLIPETVQLPPAEFHRVSSVLDSIRAIGFRIEPFGQGTFKIDAVPQIIGTLSPTDILATIAGDLASPNASRSGAKWREDLIAKSIARAYAGASRAMDAEGATRLVEELISCRMPYVCPRGKCVMIFTSIRELDRKFGRD